MSIVNAFVHRDHVLLAVDTHARLPDGSSDDRLKMLLLPHIDSAVAFRGMDVALMAGAAHVTRFSGGFDELANDMPEIVANAVMVAGQHAPAAGRTVSDAGLANFVLTGYSRREQRMMVHVFETSPGSTEVKVSRDVPDVISPFWTREDLVRLNLTPDKAGMRALAIDQCRVVRERGPADFPAGGQLLIAEIRQGSVTVERALQLPA